MTHSIQEFMRTPYLEELGTLKVMVNSIYGRSSKSFILVVVNGLGPKICRPFPSFMNFMHNTTILLSCIRLINLQQPFVKNITNVVYDEE